jgi:hypothetical protein
MKRINPTIHLVCLALIGVLSVFSTVQAATGAMGFRLNPDTTTVIAGDANAWIRPLWDWNNRPLAGNTVATPDVSRQFTVTSSRDADNLIIHVVIADATQTKLPGNGALTIGDQIVIHINPNNSKSTALELTQDNNFDTDHRYIVLLNRQSVGKECQIRHDKPVDIFGDGSFFPWNKDGTYSTCPEGSWTFNNNTSNDVTIRIPLSDLGFGIAHPIADFGLAIAFINDLGVDDPISTKAQLTSSAFPIALPISNTNNPLDKKVVAGAFIDAGGVWIQPNTWGVGYIASAPLTPNNVVLEHSPDYFAKSIRLSDCNVSNWEQVPEGNQNQVNLAGWYKYYPAAPCQMGIWVKAINKTTADVEGRLLILWADAGLGQQAWKVVKHLDPNTNTMTATTPVVFAGGVNLDSITRQIWADVPVGGSSAGAATHPCLRVYILPKDLNHVVNGQTIDDSYLLGIETDSSRIGKMEGSYSNSGQPYPNNTQASQMNFTNLAALGTSCPNAQLCGFSKISASLLPKSNAIEKPKFFAQSPVLTNKGDAIADRTHVSSSEHIPPRKVNEALVRVSVTGFGIEPALPQQPYEFVDSIGALGWAAPESLVLAPNFKPIAFTVTNPPILYRDFSGQTPKDILAPSRRIILATEIKTDSGIPAKIEVLPIKETLAPGETVTAQVKVALAPVQLPSAGLALWQWLLLFLVILLLLLILFWRKPKQP